MAAAWFVDGAYLYRAWASLGRADALDYLKLRELLEQRWCEPGERIDDAYYFNADPDPPSARQNAFHAALQYPPPNGPGLRVKLYWLQRKVLAWPKELGGETVVHPRTGQPYELVQQKAVDVGLAMHLMRSQAQRGWRTLFLAAGDADFHEPVQHLVEHQNITVVLIGTLRTISTELQPYARDIVRLDEVADALARARPPRTP